MIQTAQTSDVELANSVSMTTNHYNNTVRTYSVSSLSSVTLLSLLCFAVLSSLMEDFHIFNVSSSHKLNEGNT